MRCKIKDCENEVICKELCNKHYQRFRVHGDVDKVIVKVKSNLPCNFPECPNVALKKKLCMKHYMKLRRTGTLEYAHLHDGKAKERARKYVSQWKKDNWDTYKHYLSARKQRVKKATPPWADLEAIEAFYAGCPEGYHVDHILPLNGKNISGLHTMDNLQYLPALENLKKSNKTP